MKILPIIMCGGSGTRVWPESRESLPKQFIPLIGELSTFQMTIENLADDLFETPIVISNQDYRFLVSEQLKEIGRSAQIVLEPVRRDSGPAVAVGAELARGTRPTPLSRSSQPTTSSATGKALSHAAGRPRWPPLTATL